MKKVKKILFIVLGCVGLALGAVGAVLPLMPAFPFLLLAAFCFAKSSEKLHNWFINTKLYKKNLESFVKGKGMTWNHVCGNRTNGNWLCYDDESANWPNYTGLCLVVPYSVLYLWY